MDGERMFPVLSGKRVKSVPWRIVQRHAWQAKRNHEQTLERLAERGGLSPAELLCVLNDRHWDMRSFEMPLEREAYEIQFAKDEEDLIALIAKLDS